MTRLGLSLRAGALALALLAVSGCSGEEAGPVVLSEATPTASASATSTPTQPTEPTASATPTSTASPGSFNMATREEAEEFVKGFWATVTAVGQGKQSLSELQNLYLPSCVACTGIYEDIKEIRDKSQHVKGGEQQVVLTSYDTNEGEVALVNNVVKSMPGELVDQDGQIVHEYSGGTEIRWVFNVVRTDAGWVVQDALHLGAA